MYLVKHSYGMIFTDILNCIHIFTDILNTYANVNIKLCTRFLGYNNYFCRTILVCNARSTITMFHMHVKHDCCDIY